MKVFISRAITESSDFFRLLAGKADSVIGQSLVSFSALPFGEVPAADWLFFYSSTGVHFFAKQVGEHWLIA